MGFLISLPISLFLQHLLSYIFTDNVETLTGFRFVVYDLNDHFYTVKTNKNFICETLRYKQYIDNKTHRYKQSVKIIKKYTMTVSTRGGFCPRKGQVTTFRLCVLVFTRR